LEDGGAKKEEYTTRTATRGGRDTRSNGEKGSLREEPKGTSSAQVKKGCFKRHQGGAKKGKGRGTMSEETTCFTTPGELKAVKGEKGSPNINANPVRLIGKRKGGREIGKG